MTEQLTALIQGLLYRSESDYPFEVLEIPSEYGTLTEILAYFQPEIAENIENSYISSTLEGFFQASMRVADWMEEEEKQMAVRFGELFAFLQQALPNVSVLKVGEIERKVYILGQDMEGKWYGLRTISIET